MSKKFIISFFLFFFLLSLVNFLLAQEVEYPAIPGGERPREIPQYIQYFFLLAIFLAGLLALGAIIAAGFLYLISFGDPTKKRKAKDWFLSALLGLLILLAPVLILTILNPQLLILKKPEPKKIEKVEIPKVPIIYPIATCDERLETLKDDFSKTIDYLIEKATVGIKELAPRAWALYRQAERTRNAAYGCNCAGGAGFCVVRTCGPCYKSMVCCSCPTVFCGVPNNMGAMGCNDPSRCQDAICPGLREEIKNLLTQNPKGSIEAIKEFLFNPQTGFEKTVVQDLIYTREREELKPVGKLDDDIRKIADWRYDKDKLLLLCQQAKTQFPEIVKDCSGDKVFWFYGCH